MFPYCCRRPCFSFIPSLSPYNILPSLTTFFKSQINTSKTTVITLNIVLALSQAVIIIIIPPSFLLHPGNYTQLFLNPVCCFLLLFLSIHLSLSFFSFSSLVCLSSLTLRLSLYLSLRWLLRRGNGWACWLKQDERPSKQKPLNRELNVCPLLTRTHAYTRACENTVRDRDKTTCFQTDFCSLKKKQKKKRYVAGSLVSGIFIQRLRAQDRRRCMITEIWSLLGAPEPGNTPASPQPKCWKHATCMCRYVQIWRIFMFSITWQKQVIHLKPVATSMYTFNTLTFNERMWGGKWSFTFSYLKYYL